jgi:hypothetical protein
VFGSKVRRLHMLTDWHDLGYPHYAGTMTYERQTTIDESWIREAEEVWLAADEVYDCAKLFVNGAEQGVRIGRPFAWSVRDALRPGANQLVFETANSPAALLEGTRKRSGLAGGIRLIRTERGTYPGMTEGGNP